MSETRNPPLGVIEAIEHLAKRLPDVNAAGASSRPRWAVRDLQAVAALVRLPASIEQIALARIEGLTRINSYDARLIRDINEIAQKALGLN